ncbi:MAG TPA: hypothetical protein VIW94_07700 [Acidimicrobiia bacterium]
MIRLLLVAALAAGAAALILYQFQGTTELALWEILLVVLVFFQYRAIPERGDPLSEPLYRLPENNPARLPRTLASMELAVIDATTGYVAPDRRLRPTLQRIASHRLGRHGMTLESVRAKALLGDDAWKVLTASGDESVSSESLEALVQKLESL